MNFEISAKTELYPHQSEAVEKLLPLRCDDNSPVGAQKNIQPDFRFQFTYGFGKTGLGDKKLFCRLVHGTAVRDGKRVF